MEYRSFYRTAVEVHLVSPICDSTDRQSINNNVRRLACHGTHSGDAHCSPPPLLPEMRGRGLLCNPKKCLSSRINGFQSQSRLVLVDRFPILSYFRPELRRTVAFLRQFSPACTAHSSVLRFDQTGRAEPPNERGAGFQGGPMAVDPGRCSSL